MGRGRFDSAVQISGTKVAPQARDLNRGPRLPSANSRQLTISTLALAALACGLPRDPEGTLDRVRGGTLRVGFVVDTPWVAEAGQGAGGIEGAIATQLARSVGAGIAWRHGSETPLLTALHDGELDLVIAGLTAESPWTAKVAFTKPYYVDTVVVRGERKAIPHVLALRPGENAWHVHVERLLKSRERELAQMRHTVSGPITSGR
jgi:polar amino acid transport system substrate-binding protein